jgi:thioesterase domain-containing protein
MVHPPGGIVVCYRELAEQLSEEQPLVAIRSRGLHGREELPATIGAMAADYIDAIKIAQPVGPYVVGGWSLGGLIGYEIAQQLLAAGDQVKRLILLDTTVPEGSTDLVAPEDQSNAGLEYGIDMSLEQLSELKEDDQLPFLWQHAINLGVLSDETPVEVVNQVLSDLKALFHHHVQLTSECRLQPLDASILLVRPSDVPFQVQTSKDRGWGRLAREVQVEYVAGHHHSMVQMPQVSELAELLEQNLLHGKRALA